MGPDIFRSVSVLGCDSSLVGWGGGGGGEGGESAVWQLLLKTNHINT